MQEVGASGTCSWGQPFCRPYRQLEGSDVVVEASAHLQGPELWAAAALVEVGRTQGRASGQPLAGTQFAPGCHQPTSSAPKMAVVWEL